MKQRRVVFWLMVLMVLPLASCRTAPMYEPGRVLVHASSMQKMRSAIVESLYARGWTVTDESEGVISARLNIRAHSVSIRITYDAEGFEIAYVDSQQLHYRERGPDGKPVIHRRYNTWIKNLVKDIAVRAARSA